MWRALIASFVFQHASVESLVRKLNRNRELLSICGCNPLPRQARPCRKLVKDPEKGVTVVEFPKPGISSAPNAWNFSRFIHLMSVDAQGKSRTRTKTWFGYRLHLIADTVHELPIAFAVTRASTSESVIWPKMINELFSEDSNLKQRCKDFSADRG